MAALLTVTAGGIAVAAVALARHRAQAAADLAALAAASRLPAGASSACGQARTVAAAMRVSLRGCEVIGLDVTVTVSASTGLRAGAEASAVARAGPASPRSGARGRQGPG